jgi:hypothetical protein
VFQHDINIVEISPETDPNVLALKENCSNAMEGIS